LATDVEVIESVAQFASQGQVGGGRIRAALHTHRRGEHELGP
jgi:hypothetical protein